ncbi:MAG: HAMP domain-containing sensor histidine kinase [Rhodoluna sp.]|nr:HAMP domain-containing sensor histidine kinase [Rhodoluna sp.]
MNKKIAEGWARISLRSKLTALSVAIIGVLLVVSSSGTLSVVKTYLQQNTDSILTSTANTLADEDPTQVAIRITARQLDLPRLPSDYFISFLNADGSELIYIVSSAQTKATKPNLTRFTLSAVMRTQGLPFEVNSKGVPVAGLVNGKGWRMVAVPTTNYPGSLVVALPTDANNALLDQYRAIGASFGFLLLIISALSIWLTITSALRPLKEVERTAAAVSGGDITQRLPERPGKTEVARINTALNSMLDSIELAFGQRGKALEQMRRFVSDASHELRTPLASVRGYAELYRMGALSKKQDLTDAMARIESEAVRMTELVENLLVLARLDEKAEITKVKIDLVAMALEAGKDISLNTGIKVSVTGLAGEALKSFDVNADPGSIRQVLINLLTNAARFSPKGKPVIAAFGIEAKKTIIEVRDQGAGIPENLRDKVFERFYRADNSRNRETGGSGLGLSIVKAIVERHGGTISANETPGGGATFRIELP